MVGVGAHAEAEYFAINLGAPGLRTFKLFEHQYSGTRTEDKAITFGVPWTARGLWIVVAFRQGLHGGECGDRNRRRGVFGTADDHHIGIAMLNHARTDTDVVRARRARRNDRNIGAGVAIDDGKIAGNHVDDGCRHKKRRYAARAFFDQDGMGLLDGIDTADTGADRNAVPVCVIRRLGQAGIFDCLDTRSNAVLHEMVTTARIFGLHIGFRIEAFHASRNGDRVVGYVEVFDLPDAAFTR